MNHFKNELELGKPFLIKGKWWLPSDVSDIQYGELSYSEEQGIQLEIRGFFKGEGFTFANIISHPIICGTSLRGDKITLVEASGGRPFQFPELLTGPTVINISQQYRVDKVLLGQHFSNIEDIGFVMLTFHMPQLEDWTRQNSVNVEWKTNPKSLIIHLNEADKARADLRDGISIVLPAGWHAPFSRNSAEVWEDSLVRVTSNKQKELSSMLEILWIFRNLLALMITNPIYPVSMYGTTEVDGKPADVKIFYEFPRWFGDSKRTCSHEMLFNLGEVDDRFSEIVTRWFEIKNEIGPVYDLFFAVLDNPISYAEHKFLSLTQALESYHRLRRRNEFESKEEFEARILRLKKLIENNPEGKGDWIWLENKLNHANEPSFSARIEELVEETKEFLPFLDDALRKWLIISIKKNRNKMTHPGNCRGDLTGKQIFFINLTLKMVLEVLFLKELRFDTDAIRSSIRRIYDYKLAQEWVMDIVNAWVQ